MKAVPIYDITVNVNSLRPRDAYMSVHYPSLVQTMASHLVGAKLLSKSMLDPQEQTPNEVLVEIRIFSFKKIQSKCRLETGGHLVLASMCWTPIAETPVTF